MKNASTKLGFALALALVAALMVGVFAPAQVVQAQTPDYSIVDVVVTSSGFSILESAVVEAGLVGALSGPGPFTVFAPTDDAFRILLAETGLTAEELLADKALLTSVLTYHVAIGRYESGDVLSASGIMMLDGNTVTPSLVGGTAFINNASISKVDIITNNGVIHVIDRVLLPPGFGPAPAEEATATPTIVRPDYSIADVVITAPGFSILEAAVIEAGLAGVLSGPGSFTVFAPSDDAFRILFAETGLTAEALLADKDLLTSVLLYHVAGEEYFAADVLGASSIMMLDGNITTPSLVNGTAFINNASISNVNIVTNNGVIHVIDRVILPPSD